jgi:copper chaperone
MLCDMQTQTISVPDISCDHCKMSIEGATAALDGVTRSDVDIPGKTVTVEFESDRVDLETIVAAIEEQGYDVAP